MLHGAWARGYHAGDFLVAVSHQAMAYQYIKATTYYTGTWPSGKTTMSCSLRHYTSLIWDTPLHKCCMSIIFSPVANIVEFQAATSLAQRGN